MSVSVSEIMPLGQYLASTVHSNPHCCRTKSNYDAGWGWLKLPSNDHKPEQHNIDPGSSMHVWKMASTCKGLTAPACELTPLHPATNVLI